jgi:hypothetical protein
MIFEPPNPSPYRIPFLPFMNRPTGKHERQRVRRRSIDYRILHHVLHVQTPHACYRIKNSDPSLAQAKKSVWGESWQVDREIGCQAADLDADFQVVRVDGVPLQCALGSRDVEC